MEETWRAHRVPWHAQSAQAFDLNTSSPPRVVAPSSPAAPILIEKERVEEQIEERDKSASATESPPTTQNLPPPSEQRLINYDALGEYWDREEEELAKGIHPDKVEDNDLDTTPRPQSRAQPAPSSKKARGKQPARAEMNRGGRKVVRAQFQMYCNKALLGAFGVLLSELTPDKLNEGFSRVRGGP